MKKSNFLNLLGKFLMAMFAIALAVYALAPDIANTFIEVLGLTGAFGGSSTLAMAITATDTRENAKTLKPDSAEKPGHLANDVSKMVTMIKPDESPIDTILRELESEEPADDIQVNFEEVEIRGRQVTVNGQVLAAGTTTDADKYKNIIFDSTANIVQGEYLLTRTVSGLNSKPLVVRVESVIDSTTIKAVPINTTDNVMPTIADNTVFYRIAPGSGELEAQAASVTQYPDMRYNYCQRFMAQVEESFIRKQVKARSNFGFEDQNYMRLYDMKNSLESQSLFGQMSRVWSQEEKEFIYTAEGIYYQLDQELSYAGSDLTNAKWIDWTKVLFADNSGAEDRLLVGGSNLIAEILKIPSVEKQQEAERVELVPGVKVMKVETTFGIVYIKFHKMFDQMGHSDEGLILDMTNIKRRTFQPLKSEKLDLKRSGQKNVDARLISEISCLETRYLDTHRRIVKS